MDRIFLFVILSVPIVLISRRTLFDFRSHGFYRFFSWECIIWLFVSNYTFWFNDPFSIRQVFSWIYLFWSAYVVIAGVILLKKSGKPMIRCFISLKKLRNWLNMEFTGISGIRSIRPSSF